MSWAERAYEYRTNGKRKQEDEQDIANRLMQRRNRVFERISKIDSHKELMRFPCIWSKNMVWIK